MWVYLWAFVRYWLVKASMASLSVHLSPLEKLTQKKERRIDETEEKSIRTKELIIRQPNAVLFLSHFSSLLLAFSMSLFDFRFVVFFLLSCMRVLCIVMAQRPLQPHCHMHFDCILLSTSSTTATTTTKSVWNYIHAIWVSECVHVCVLSMCWALSILRVFWFSFKYFMNFSGLVTTVLTVPCHSNGTKNNNNKNRSLYV